MTPNRPVKICEDVDQTPNPSLSKEGNSIPYFAQCVLPRYTRWQFMQESLS